MDNNLDFLYGQCYSQLTRIKYFPTYVERRILSEHVNMIRNYLLKFVRELEKKVNEYEANIGSSYLVYDRKFYQDEVLRFKEDIVKFVKDMKETKSEDFMGRDFESVSEELEKKFPNHLPKSNFRKVLIESFTHEKTN